MSTRKHQQLTADPEKLSDSSPGHGDVALGFFEDIHTSNDVDDRKLLWNIDMRLMPLM